MCVCVYVEIEANVETAWCILWEYHVNGLDFTLLFCYSRTVPMVRLSSDGTTVIVPLFAQMCFEWRYTLRLRQESDQANLMPAKKEKEYTARFIVMIITNEHRFEIKYSIHARLCWLMINTTSIFNHCGNVIAWIINANLLLTSPLQTLQ